MASLLLPVIYIAFVSLGLPDALLGSAWPAVYPGMNVPISAAGIVTFIIACGTVVSSLMSDRMTRLMGPGLVTAVSVLTTAAALAGFSFSSQFWMLCVWAVPYGLGAGGVDAALNNYVALHYSSRHMNWLHCSWGVGLSIGPYIMSACLLHNCGWNMGYRVVSVLQIALTVVLFLSLPLWKKRVEPEVASDSGTAQKSSGLGNVLKIPGIPLVLAGFFCYCALESTAILWSCSYLAVVHEFSAERAAGWGAIFYLGILAGRFLSGFVSNRLGDRKMIRIGLVLIAAGLASVFTGFPPVVLAGLLIVGLGCAPVYPSIIHETPLNFGAENSQAIVGLQMASAYIGTSLMPPLFGWLAQHITMKLFPFFLLIFAVAMFLLLEKLNKTVDRRNA